jgi:intracellular sulfur oxidation DsrE/DsrF family protein
MKPPRLTLASPLLLLALFVYQTSAIATGGIDALLKADEPPAGVVFEIVSDDRETLGRLLPGLQADIKRLRVRFPGLPVAVVSHGEEQFALTNTHRTKEPELHAIAEAMVSGEDVDLHVCGAHAGWFGLDPGDFPDYVDVSASGPAQINDYRALDYVLITLP